MKKMKIIMLGAPGAGKGTQAKKIAEKYTIPHISTGDIFRANIKNNTELGQKAKTYMDKGELVPDELVVDLIMDRFKEADGICDACGEKLILRDDDKPETVKNRLSVYHEQTQPLIDYYAKKNVLAEVDGTKDMEDVFNDIVTILGK